MTTTAIPSTAVRTQETPTERVLTASLVGAPLLYLAADSTYAVTTWHDPTAGVLHVLGATAYGLVVLRVASWLPRESLLTLAVTLTGLVGLAGNVAYGFDTIHMSLGDVALVHRTGAAELIKPYGLFFPLSLALMAWGLVRLGRRWQGALVVVAAAGWPIAHIGNLGWLAVAVNVALVVGFGGLAWATRPPGR